MIKFDNYISIRSSETTSFTNPDIQSTPILSRSQQFHNYNTMEFNTPGPSPQNNRLTEPPMQIQTTQQNISIIFLNSFIFSISNLFFSFGFVASIYYLSLSLSTLSRKESKVWLFIGWIFAILIFFSVILMVMTLVYMAKYVRGDEENEEPRPHNSVAKEWKYMLLLTSLANVVNYITNIIQYVDINTKKISCISSVDYGLDFVMISYNIVIIIFSFQIERLNFGGIKKWPCYFLMKLTVTIAIGISGAILCYEAICDTFNTYKLINKVSDTECYINSTLTNVSQTVNKYLNITAPLSPLLFIFILFPIATSLDVDKLIKDKLLNYIPDEEEVGLGKREEEEKEETNSNNNYYNKVYLTNNLLNVLIAGGLLIFLASFCTTFYDIIEASKTTTRATCVLYTFPIIPITICIILSYKLLHHTVIGIPFKLKSVVKYKCFQFLNWITLGGQLINLINYTITAIGCIYKIDNSTNKINNQNRIEFTFYVLIILVNFVCIFQSLIQSTVLDWLLRLKCDDNISVKHACKIFNYTWIMMSFNFGCAIHNHLMNSNETIFVIKFKHDDMKYFYYILSILSYPFNTLYRIVGGVILIIFMTQLKSK